MTRFISIILFFIFSLTVLSCYLKNFTDGYLDKKDAGPFSVWDGYTLDELKISGNAYEVKKASELVWLSRQPVNTFNGKTIKLMINIDLAGYEFEGFANLSSYNIFKGSFEGNKKIVKNFYISKTEVNYVGFIGYLANTAIIRDLYIENATIQASGNGFGGVGSIVGFNDGGVVYGCYSTASVTVNVGGGNARGIGGIIGYNRNGVLSFSYNTGEITANNMTTGVGGLVGYTETLGNAEIKNSYNIGSVYGNESVGGVIGYNQGSIISKCYNTAYVDGNYFVGGIIGFNTEIGIVNSCYYNDALVVRDSIGGGKGSGSRIEALSETYFSSLTSFENYYSYDWVVMTSLSGNISIRPVLVNIGQYASSR